MFSSRINLRFLRFIVFLIEFSRVSLSVLVKGLLSYSGDESSLKSYVKEMNRVALEAPERSGGLCFFSLFACMKSLQQMACVKDAGDYCS